MTNHTVIPFNNPEEIVHTQDLNLIAHYPAVLKTDSKH